MREAAYRVLGVTAPPKYGCTDGATALKDALLANYPGIFVGNCYAHVNRSFGSGGSIYKVYSAAGKGLVEETPGEAPPGQQAHAQQQHQQQQPGRKPVKPRRATKRKQADSQPAGPTAAQQARTLLDALASMTNLAVFTVGVSLFCKHIREVQKEPAAAALFEKSCCAGVVL